MTSTDSGNELLPVDARGRVQVSRERRAAILAEYDRSGVSAAKFAALVGVKYSTLAGWVQRRRKAAGVNAATADGEAGGGMRWVEAVIAPRGMAPAASALSVHLPCGARLEVSDARGAALAAELLRCMGAGSGRAVGGC